VPTSASSSTPAAPVAVAPPSNSLPGDSDQKATKKEKKENPAKKEASVLANDTKTKGAAPPVAASDSGEPWPSMIDLRVGRLCNVFYGSFVVALDDVFDVLLFLVARHPDADGPYVEVRSAVWWRTHVGSNCQSWCQQIDIGEETGPRTVVSGLVNCIPIEQMQDRTIIVVVL
jgi:aminoacyl tRNA synthase complex-interacting multifunctional protein 1